MKRLLTFILVTGLAGLSQAAADEDRSELITVAPDGYQASGNTIEEWTWLRAGGDFAEWEWAPANAAPGDACLNLSALVTNHPNGGSGHDARVRVTLYGNGGESRTIYLALRNPFRPIVESDTGGKGYQAYGAACSRSLAGLVPVGFRMRVEWDDASRMNVAVRREAALLAYTIRPRPPDDALR